MQITSEFPLTVIRAGTTNSYDRFRNAKQAEKATLEVSVNAEDPAFKSMMLKELVAIQPEVDECHASEGDQRLLHQKKPKKQVDDEGLAQYIIDQQYRHADQRADARAKRKGRGIHALMNGPGWLHRCW